MATNSNHYVPRLLMKAWCHADPARYVWVCDLLKEKVEERALEQLCCLPGDEEINALWNDLVEQPAQRALEMLRGRRPRSAPDLSMVEEVRGLAPGTLDALFHFFWAFRPRHPDTPPAWGGISEKEYIALLQDETKNRNLLDGLQAKYRLQTVSINEATRPLALTDYTVFPLRPIHGRAVFCLPVAPSRALLMVDKRIEPPKLVSMVGALNLGEISIGGPFTLVCLPGTSDWSNPTVQIELMDEIRKSRLKWMPKIVGTWPQEVDLSE